MTNDELAELERHERQLRLEALHNPDADNRWRARQVELETYAAELGDDD